MLCRFLRDILISDPTSEPQLLGIEALRSANKVIRIGKKPQHKGYIVSWKIWNTNPYWNCYRVVRPVLVAGDGYIYPVTQAHQAGPSRAATWHINMHLNWVTAAEIFQNNRIHLVSPSSARCGLFTPADELAYITLPAISFTYLICLMVGMWIGALWRKKKTTITHFKITVFLHTTCQTIQQKLLTNLSCNYEYFNFNKGTVIYISILFTLLLEIDIHSNGSPWAGSGHTYSYWLHYIVMKYVLILDHGQKRSSGP